MRRYLADRQAFDDGVLVGPRPIVSGQGTTITSGRPRSAPS
jgi:hypothetical protein